MPAQQQGLRFFFPSTAKLVTRKAHGDGGHLPGTPPQMTAQFVGPKNDVEKSSSVQVVEIFCRVFYLIGLPRALIDEAPHHFPVRHTQAMLFLHFLVTLKLRVADRDKMSLAKPFSIKSRTGSLVTTLDAALFSVRHSRETRSLCRTVSTIPLRRTLGQRSLLCQASVSCGLVHFLVRPPLAKRAVSTQATIHRPFPSC